MYALPLRENCEIARCAAPGPLKGERLLVLTAVFSGSSSPSSRSGNRSFLFPPSTTGERERDLNGIALLLRLPTNSRGDDTDEVSSSCFRRFDMAAARAHGDTELLLELFG